MSSGTYTSSKDLVIPDQLRKEPGMTNKPENCTIDERIMEYLEASYNKMLTHHIAGHHCHEKEGSFVNQLFIQEYSHQKVIACHCSPERKIGDSFQTLPNFVSQNTRKRQAWNKNCHNRTGTKMGENECRSFRIRSITCKYWQSLQWFSKFNWLNEGCVIWRLANTRCHC